MLCLVDHLRLGLFDNVVSGFTCCVLHDWCVFRFVLLICLLAVMAGCMFCCFVVVCCVVYMQNSD